MVVNTAEELGKKVQSGENYIEIEGDLANKVYKIKTKGKVAWAVAFGSVAVAIVAIIAFAPSAATTGPVGPVVSGFVLAGSTSSAVSILGISTTIAAISMAVAVKDKMVLTKLRENYVIAEKGYNRVVIKRK